MMGKIYISGPMTGYANFNREAFNDEADRIKAGGLVPLNPAILPDGLSQFEYMDICMAMLRCADAIFMLPGWQKSDGAKAELALAKKLKIKAYDVMPGWARMHGVQTSGDDCRESGVEQTKNGSAE